MLYPWPKEFLFLQITTIFHICSIYCPSYFHIYYITQNKIPRFCATPDEKHILEFVIPVTI